MELVQFISDSILRHNTSIGNNKALPNGDAFIFNLLENRFSDVVSTLKSKIGYVPTIKEAENMLNHLTKKVMEIEKPLRPQLEKLCESVVNAVLGIPQETLIIECQLVDKIEPYTEIRVLPEEDDYSFDDKINVPSDDDVLKRRLVNSLVQGVSYWLMYDTIDADALNTWSSELMPLYDKVIALNDYLIYTKEEKISDKNPMLGSFVETHLGQGTDKTVIEAQGLIYPLLLQETYRGLFELYGSHGLPDDSKKANYIIHKADYLLAEAWDLRLGSALWECIEKCTLKKPLNNVYPYLFTSLVQLPVNDFNELTRQILGHTEHGKRWIEYVVKKVVHDEEYQLFKQDIQNFNLDKCVINDEESHEDVLDEETIKELLNLNYDTIKWCRNKFGNDLMYESLSNISNYLEPINEEIKKGNINKAQQIINQTKIQENDSQIKTCILNEILNSQKKKINSYIAFKKNKFLNESILNENKYSKQWDKAYKELQSFKLQGEKKYGTPYWYNFGWMKYKMPDIHIEPNDEQKYKELEAKEKELARLWSESNEQEEEENKKELEKWSSEQANLIDLAVEQFGTTSRLTQAGYILPDGRLLNFGENGDRGTDHRAIEGIYIKNGIKIWDDKYRYNYVVDFLNHGAIRIDGNTGLIDMTMEPTTEEYRVLKELVRETGGEAYMDFTDNKGNTLCSVEYDHVSGARLVSDIKKYYHEGINPIGDISESAKKKHVLKEEKNIQKQKLNTVVADDNGNPILCYHSTQAIFNSFDPNKINSGGAGCYHGFGFNFTTNQNTTYGPNVIEAYLIAKNPLWDKKKTINLKKLINILIEIDNGEIDSIVCNFTGNNPKIGGSGYYSEIKEAAESILDYAEGDLDVYASICTASCCSVQKVIDVFSKLGYDSAIETNEDGKLRVVVVFHPEQIKIVSEPLIKENRNVIKEGISDIIYHYCSLTSLYDILESGKIALTMSSNIADAHHKTKLFYLSTQRSKNNKLGYAGNSTKHGKLPTARIELDGALLKQDGHQGIPIDYWGALMGKQSDIGLDSARLATNYGGTDKIPNFDDKDKKAILKSQGTSSNFEFEDRIFSSKPSMPLKYIKRIDCFEEHPLNNGIEKAILELADKDGVFVGFYTSEKDFIMQTDNTANESLKAQGTQFKRELKGTEYNSRKKFNSDTIATLSGALMYFKYYNILSNGGSMDSMWDELYNVLKKFNLEQYFEYCKKHMPRIIEFIEQYIEDGIENTLRKANTSEIFRNELSENMMLYAQYVLNHYNVNSISGLSNYFQTHPWKSKYNGKQTIEEKVRCVLVDGKQIYRADNTSFWDRFFDKDNFYSEISRKLDEDDWNEKNGYGNETRSIFHKSKDSESFLKYIKHLTHNDNLSLYDGTVILNKIFNNNLSEMATIFGFTIVPIELNKDTFIENENNINWNDADSIRNSLFGSEDGYYEYRWPKNESKQCTKDVLKEEIDFTKPICISINCDSQDFDLEIINGEKTIETRDNKKLDKLVGHKIGLIKTSKYKKPVLFAYCVLGNKITYLTDDDFDKDYNKHRVANDSIFHISKTKNKIKYGYPIESLEVLDNPIEIHGGEWIGGMYFTARYLTNESKKLNEYLDKMSSDAMRSLGTQNEPSELASKTYRYLRRDTYNPKKGETGFHKNDWLIHITDVESGNQIMKTGFKSKVQDLNFAATQDINKELSDKGLCFACEISDVDSWYQIINEIEEFGGDWCGIIFQANAFNTLSLCGTRQIREVVFSSKSAHNMIMLLPMTDSENNSYLKHNKNIDSENFIGCKTIDKNGKCIFKGDISNLFDRKGAWNKPRLTPSYAENYLNDNLPQFQNRTSNIKQTNESKHLNEYLDKDYMKPLFDYLKNGERYSSGGYYNATERLVLPFFKWATTKLDDGEWKEFSNALKNCKQLKGKVKGSDFMGHHSIECYTQLSDGLKQVNTNYFLKQNAKHIFNVTYNQDTTLSKFWDEFMTQFINTKEGGRLLSNNKFLDADTVLMNPELKKPQWLIHLTPKKDDALNIVQNGFQYGLSKNQMSKLGYTNNGINKEDKQGKFLYAYNALEIANNIFPTNFMVSDKSQHKYDKPFDQKTWEYASNFAIMFTAPGIQAYHGTDKQNQVIFASDTAHNYILLTRNSDYTWQVNTTDGKVVYKNNSLTNVVNWVINNFSQYRKQICWKK